VATYVSPRLARHAQDGHVEEHRPRRGQRALRQEAGEERRRHAIYYTLVGARMAAAKVRRAARKVVYQVLMLTHRAGLRGRTNTR
jgi:hypothetical protein